jgi:hypothetical protein
MTTIDRGRSASFLVAVVLVLGACETEPAPLEPAARTPVSDATPQKPASPFGTDPDGEDWFLSETWMATAPCRTKAQVAYTHVGLRMRGQRLQDQILNLRARTDIALLDPATRAAIESMIDEVYAAPTAELADLGTRVAADCLATTPQVGVDREHALRCYRHTQEEVVQRLYRDQLPAQAGVRGTDLDFAFHRCLRGGPT